MTAIKGLRGKSGINGRGRRTTHSRNWIVLSLSLSLIILCHANTSKQIILQKIQKVHDQRIIGETKFPYKECSPILNILKIKK